MRPIDRGPDGPQGRIREPWFRTAIEADRTATHARVRSLRSEIDDISAGVADANTDDEHDPEGATIAFERARATALLADALAHLSALDRAEVRLEAGNHTECAQCGGTIAKDRLAARPAAVTCIECAAGSPDRSGPPVPPAPPVPPVDRDGGR